MSGSKGRTSKVMWPTKSALDEAVFYCLGKGVILNGFLRFTFYQYIARCKLKPHEIARAEKILAERSKIKPWACASGAPTIMGVSPDVFATKGKI